MSDWNIRELDPHRLLEEKQVALKKARELSDRNFSNTDYFDRDDSRSLLGIFLEMHIARLEREIIQLKKEVKKSEREAKRMKSLKRDDPDGLDDIVELLSNSLLLGEEEEEEEES